MSEANKPPVGLLDDRRQREDKPQVAHARQDQGEVQMSRRYYNGAARDLNVKVESFPSNFVANYFKFDKAEYFEIENASDREVPQVKF